MRFLLVYHRRLGDIIQLLPACRHLAQQGHEVWFECDVVYHDIFACVDYVRPVAPGAPRNGYDRVLELAIHPSSGGTRERYDAYRASGLRWADFVYDIPEIRGSYGPPCFTHLAHCTPAAYGLPGDGDYVLLAPTGYSQQVVYNPAKLATWCNKRWPGKRIFVLMDKPNAQFPPFVRARRLRDLPAIVSWAKHFASINTSTAIIAAGVRQSYVHFPQTGAAVQDDTAFPRVSEVVVPFEPEPVSLELKVANARRKLGLKSAVGAPASPHRGLAARRKIAFFTTLNRNVGDEFIREGVRAILDAAKVEYDPYFICKHTPATVTTPSPEETGEVADKYWDADVVIQAGAPVYWHFHEGRSTSLKAEWQEWFWEQRVLGAPQREHPLFLNLGAGSCLPWGDVGDAFVADAACVDFARRAGTRAALTTVREAVASSMLERLQVPHFAMPCPAFLAGARHDYRRQAEGPIGVNLMPLGGHFDLNAGFDQTQWLEDCLQLLARLRSLNQVFFVAHNAEEEKFLGMLREPGEPVFCGAHWRAYLETYGQCSMVVANRVHGAVCAAGLGVPAMIVGNDTRAEIGRFIGLPIHRSGHVRAAALFESAERLWRNRAVESERLRALRDATLARYVEAVAPLDLGGARMAHRALAC